MAERGDRVLAQLSRMFQAMVESGMVEREDAVAFLRDEASKVGDGDRRRHPYDDADVFKEADGHVSYLQEIRLFDNAEDVKTVQFEGPSTIVDVEVTDETMMDFRRVADDVCREIHKDMTEMEAILNSAPSDLDDPFGLGGGDS